MTLPEQHGKSRHPISERLASLRKAMRRIGVDGYIVPRTDKFQSGMIAPQDQRLAWLTGFTGSAGCFAATIRSAALEVDGRYDVQARLQVDAEEIEVLVGMQDKLPAWIARALQSGSTVGFDPWLHTRQDVRRIRRKLHPNGLELRSAAGLVDRIWTDRPDSPTGPAYDYPIKHAGERREKKIERMSRELSEARANAAILTKPESIAWLLNIRGSDVDYSPIVQAYAVLTKDCRVELFADPRKFGSDLADALKPDVRIRPFDVLPSALAELSGRTLVDPRSAPERLFELLEENEVRIVEADDPCVNAKSIKNKVEIKNHESAQERDGVAVAKFLAWIDRRAADSVTELEAAAELERLRRSSGKLKGLSFATIAASGPHGAIIHYHPTADTNRKLKPGDLFLVDSGGQYLDGTTDVTRTIVIGEPTEDQRRDYTRVLKSLIALSKAKWPPERTGRDLDTIARYPLWLSGQDFKHGTGHGVGHFLAVHEGPQSVSTRFDEPLMPGMIVSVEPGLYLEGRYGIRLENLALVAACSPESSDGGEFLRLETLTFAPFDRRLINASELSRDECRWLNRYHSSVLAKIGPHLTGADLDWLEKACAAVC